MIQTPTPTTHIEAFCQMCPSDTHVTQQLARLGFCLTFQLASATYPSSNGGSLPIFQPAQYHYEDRVGTQVIYLAGRDHAEEGQPTFPPHASRWWIYPGRSEEATIRTKKALSSCWLMMWIVIEEKVDEDEAC